MKFRSFHRILRDSQADRDYIFCERLLHAPSISWKPNESSIVTFQYEFITDDYTQDRGQVLDGDNVTDYSYSIRSKPKTPPNQISYDEIPGQRLLQQTNEGLVLLIESRYRM